MRPLTHPATVAFGLANLYLLDLTGPLIATDHDLIYHLIGSASSVIIPIIVYVITLSLLLTALLYLAERPGALRVIIWSAFLLALPSILLHTIANFSGNEIPDWVTYSRRRPLPLSPLSRLRSSGKNFFPALKKSSTLLPPFWASSPSPVCSSSRSWSGAAGKPAI